MAYPPGWDPAEEARALAYRLERRARGAATALRERRAYGNPAARLALDFAYLALMERTRNEREPADPESRTIVNG
jgi:hypothetical protein